MGNVSAWLILDGPFSNILAMKFAYPEETSPCCKFCPSADAVIPGPFRVIREKAASSCRERDPKC